jgi:NAD(P)-dependent dehydrogenase (short-subunit alcohol dehydrogenase family)
VALITGGASGLGAATARALGQRRLTLRLLDRDTARGQAIAGEIGGAYVGTDVTDPEDVQDAVRQATALGPLRVAVNCAGIGDGARVVGRNTYLNGETIRIDAGLRMTRK